MLLLGSLCFLCFPHHFGPCHTLAESRRVHPRPYSTTPGSRVAEGRSPLAYTPGTVAATLPGWPLVEVLLRNPRHTSHSDAHPVACHNNSLARGWSRSRHRTCVVLHRAAPGAALPGARGLSPVRGRCYDC